MKWEDHIMVDEKEERSDEQPSVPEAIIELHPDLKKKFDKEKGKPPIQPLPEEEHK
jgi:hypothetical protein